VPRERFHREVFSSITGDPFAPAPASDQGSAAETVDTTVLLDGVAHRFAWPTGTTLVDALLAECVDVPYSCRSGECGSCVCRVVGGSVSGVVGDVFEPDEVAAGYVLGCQSRPDEGPIEIEF
jgi:3-ketosteroid 9alpha-monooxygenase subunit B